MARFQPGERVAVRMADPPGHIRTPWYCRGKFGVIERLCGSFENPESLAYGLGGEPKRPLYRVRFDQRALWPDYQGAVKDTVEIEIYEHWLVPAKEGADA